MFEKAAIPATAGIRSDHVIFYNYTAKLILKRLLLTAQSWPGGPRPLIVTFGHVRGFKHPNTLAYLKMIEAQERRRFRNEWSLLHGLVKWTGAGDYDGLQVADQYAGMLSAALCPDSYGGYEAAHLLAVRHQIRRYRGSAWGAGFKVLAQHGTMSGYPWWPAEGM